MLVVAGTMVMATSVDAMSAVSECFKGSTPLLMTGRASVLVVCLQIPDRLFLKLGSATAFARRVTDLVYTCEALCEAFDIIAALGFCLEA